MTTPTFARQYQAPILPRPLPFGLLSVAEIVDGNGPWMLGGVEVDGDICPVAQTTGLPCSTDDYTKEPSNLFTTYTGDPYAVYVLNSCKTLGRMDDAMARATRALDRTNAGAIETGFHDSLLTQADEVGTGLSPLAAVGVLEEYAGCTYGAQATLHIPRSLVPLLNDYVTRVDGHLETKQGNLVANGCYGDGDTMWATGPVRLYRSAVASQGPVIDRATNDFYALAERVFAPLIDCLNVSAGVTV